MIFLDLFSGIGGFAYGAYLAGMRFDEHYFSEIDKYCIDLYSKRFPFSIGLGDICKIDAKNLPQGTWIVTGGFPCQDISIAGRGRGIMGKRSSLWFAMWAIIRILRPRFAIIENVGAITHRGLDTVLGCLAEIGYGAEWQDIRASDMGAPHKRERIWILAYPSSKRERKLSIRQRGSFQTTCNLNGSGQEISDTVSKYDDDAGHGTGEVCGQRSEKAEIQRCVSNTPGQGLQRGKPTKENKRKQGLFTECCGWMFEPDVGMLVDGLSFGLDRFEGRLSSKSYKRADQLKGLGNSIVPQIAELLFRRIKDLM